MLVPRHSRYLELDLQPVAKHAYKLGGTVHDLTVAATLRAAAAAEPDRETVSLLVPISRRTAADANVRNHISMAKVTVSASAPIEELVPAVRAQVQAAVEDTSRRDLGEARLERLRHVRHLGPASSATSAAPRSRRSPDGPRETRATTSPASRAATGRASRSA